MKVIRKRLTYANVVSTIAVFLVLGGGAAVAADQLGKNSVGSKQLKKNAVTAAKLKNNAVTAAKLANGAVTNAKLADNAVTGAKVDEASLGEVPNAKHAGTAGRAETAGNASHAETAGNATALDGRALNQVRPVAEGLSDTTSQGLDSVTFELVMERQVTVPTGGARLVINASTELSNNTGGQLGGACRISRGASQVSSTYNATLSAGHSETIGMTAFAPTNAGTFTVEVFCQGSGSDNDISFVNGDLTVQAIPVG